MRAVSACWDRRGFIAALAGLGSRASRPRHFLGARICSMRLFCCCASPGSAKTIGESRRICRCGRASGKSFSESHPSLGIAGRNAAGGCHFFQELRSCGSDERPTGRDRDQLGQWEGLSHGPDSQIAPDGRPLTALGGPRNQPEASRILRRDCGIDVEGAKTDWNTQSNASNVLRPSARTPLEGPRKYRTFPGSEHQRMTQAGCALLGPDHLGAPWLDVIGCPRFAVWWGWGGFFWRGFGVGVA